MSPQNFREYLDDLLERGYSIDHDITGSDPDLIDPGGSPVDTWREDYPYDDRMSREEYEQLKYDLQVELLKFQYWTQDVGGRHVLLFEGRDAAGKGGTIKRFTEHLNPRVCAHVVALGTSRATTERGPVVFPAVRPESADTAGQSGAVRPVLVQPVSGVERVMGFCTEEQHALFLKQAPVFERMLIEAGTSLTKFWFSVTSAEQRTRFAIRQIDPVRQWKLSPMDVESLDKWEAYTAAKEETFLATDTDAAPWITIKSNDKKRARINAMRYFLSQFEYQGKDHRVVGEADPNLVTRGRDAVGD
jgi:polyphosphate kinase 2